MTPVWVTDSATTDLRLATRYTLLWGLEGVVLRTVGGQGDRVPFINEAAVRARLREDDLPIVAVDPGLFEGDPGARAGWLNDLDALDDVLRFCTRMGCFLIRVGALAATEGPDAAAADALRQAGDRAARAGMRLAVRNEAATAVDTGTALSGLLAAVAHPSVGADWHPLDAAQAGEAVADGLRSLAQTPGGVVCVGVADATEAGVPVSPGDGIVGWGRHLQDLVSLGYDGPLALRVDGRPARSAGLDASTALVRLLRAARR